MWIMNSTLPFLHLESLDSFTYWVIKPPAEVNWRTRRNWHLLAKIDYQSEFGLFASFSMTHSTVNLLSVQVPIHHLPFLANVLLTSISDNCWISLQWRAVHSVSQHFETLNGNFQIPLSINSIWKQPRLVCSSMVLLFCWFY